MLRRGGTRSLMPFDLYPDTILFAVGVLFLLVAIIFIIYLLLSYKRSRVYASYLREETQTFDAITATSTLSQSQVLNTGNNYAQNNYAPGNYAPNNFAPNNYDPNNYASNNQASYHPAASFQNPSHNHDMTTAMLSSQTMPGAHGAHGGYDPAANPHAGVDRTGTMFHGAGTGRAMPQYSPSIPNPTSLKQTDYSTPGGFNYQVIQDSYEIVREVGGGAMSRTFVVRSKKLGNLWFLKFVSGHDGRLMGEEHILKLLNHISLPRIIDVYHRQEGVYLIVTLIEGIALNQLGGTGIKLGQYVLADWFEQIAQTLSYLHNMKPTPLLHLDLKPGNVMITHDNRLVLVDFGISRRIGEDASGAVTAAYAAPEQFRGSVPPRYADLLGRRFGSELKQSAYWQIDVRTDLYSLGVIMFELATGQPPTLDNQKVLQDHVSKELCDIILKCIQVNPAARYQSTAQLLDDLRAVKGSKIKIARSLVLRKFAKAAVFVAFLFSAAAMAGGFYVYSVETGATLFSQPDVVTVSLQQSTFFAVERTMPDGRVIILDNDHITWRPSESGIAQIDGTRVTGLNLGETVFTGSHRNGDISLTVRVVEPIDDLIQISQRFAIGRSISVFAGSEARQRVDGPLAQMDFFSPESISVSQNGSVYFTDAGVIRVLRGGPAGSVETISISPPYISADMVRLNGNDPYILSAPWQDGPGYFFTIARIRGGAAEKYFVLDARHTAIEDFTFARDGTMYFIERNAGLGVTILQSICADRAGITALTQLPAGSSSLAVGQNGELYIGNTDLGIIYVYSRGELRYFAGISGERGFIDGASARFYMPQRLEYRSGFLYVWDFNTLRRVEARGAVAGDTISIAGIASPVYSPHPGGRTFAAEDIILPHGRMIDFALTDFGILLTDHKRGITWIIDY